MSTELRVITYNTGAGNPRVGTPAAAFLALPFYRDALGDAPGAPVLALQEVGPEQARLLRTAAAAGACRVLQARRPGLGNALVLPARLELLAARRGVFVGSHVRGAADAIVRRARAGARPDWPQLGEARTWIEARVRDRGGGPAFALLTTHLSVEPALKVAQGRAIAGRALTAPGRVILAGDLNLPARDPRGRDRELAAALAGLEDMGSRTPAPGRPDIDRVLARGFAAVAARTWTEYAELSDHDPLEVVLRPSSAG